jgi:BMFP domain-containing protein YqiC
MIEFLAQIAIFGAGLAAPGAPAMDDKKSTRFSLDELARQLAESVPQNLKVLGQDLERNFKTLLQSGIERMELVSREEFDVQRAVLERTRAKLEAMEARLADLEKALSSRP